MISRAINRENGFFLQRKKFIKIIRGPKNKFEPLVIQKNHTTVVPVTTAINFQDSASTVFTVNPEGMTASIVVTAISAISSAESVMLNAPVDPAWGANINGKVVRYTGAFYTPALADSAVNALAIGIAKNYDVVKGTADIFLFGMVDGLGLTGTELQYLSATNFGMMEPTAPINGVTVPLGTPQGSNFFLNIDLNQNIFVDTFSMTDWFSTDAGDLYSLDFTHGLGIMFPRIAVYDEATKDQVWVDRTRVLDSDTLRISVCQEAVDGRFFGAITIGR